MTVPDFSAQQAAIAAVVQGNLPQLRLIVESINDRLVALESQGSEHTHSAPNLDAISEIDPPADDAKTIEIRGTVLELVDGFNSLVRALKGE